MKRNLIYCFIFIFCSFQTIAYAQLSYSELALTGRGDLKLVGDEVKLQPSVYNAYLKMREAALKEGVSIQIVSGYRSFDRQKQIWNRKYVKFISKGMKPQNAIDEIIKYSTIPGTSRHHWGTDIDIIDNNVAVKGGYLTEENYSDDGAYVKLKKWMDLNSERFGFYIVYTDNITRKGFKHEPWHYSYKELSYSCLSSFLKIDLLLLLRNLDIKGQVFFTNDFIEKYLNEYVSDINPILK